MLKEEGLGNVRRFLVEYDGKILLGNLLLSCQKRWAHPKCQLTEV